MLCFIEGLIVYVWHKSFQGRRGLLGCNGLLNATCQLGVRCTQKENKNSTHFDWQHVPQRHVLMGRQEQRTGNQIPETPIQKREPAQPHRGDSLALPLADDTGGSEPPTDAAPPVTAPINPFRQALQAFLPRPTPAANVAAAAAVGYGLPLLSQFF